VKGLPKNRHYDLDISNPLSDSYRAGGKHSDQSDDTLQQFFGFKSREPSQISDKDKLDDSPKPIRSTSFDNLDKNNLFEEGKIEEKMAS